MFKDDFLKPVFEISAILAYEPYPLVVMPTLFKNGSVFKYSKTVHIHYFSVLRTFSFTLLPSSFSSATSLFVFLLSQNNLAFHTPSTPNPNLVHRHHCLLFRSLPPHTPLFGLHRCEDMVNNLGFWGSGGCEEGVWGSA